jgi:hypothetical protein
MEFVARWCSILVAVAVLSVPATATAAWTPPAPVPGASGQAFGPFLEFSGSGTGLITTELDKRGTLGSTVTGDTPGPVRRFSPRLRLFGWALYGKDGVVGVGYQGHRSIQAGFGTIAGGITRLQTIATGPTVGTFDIDANARGTAAIVFNMSHGLYLAVRHPGGRFGAAVRISGSRHALVSPQVQVNPAGDVLAAWIASGPYPRCGCRSPRQAVVARIISAKGRVSSIQRLGPGAAFQDIELAFADNRTALVGWVHEVPAVTIRVAYASAGGRWHRTQILDTFSGKRAEFDPSPGIRVAFSSDGHGQAVWDSGVPSSRLVRGAELSGTTWGAPNTLSAPAVNTTVESLAAGAGELAATWTQGGTSAPKVFAAVRSGTQWGPAEQIGAGAGGQVAIDPRTGVPFVAFWTNSGVFYSKRTP